ncbi:MAG: glutaminase, partial [Pseudomonadota bacterium]
MQELIEKAVSYGKAFTHEGKTATYIPELAKADPSQLGVSVVTGDGRISRAGDFASLFTVQSISKVVSLMLAIIDRGEEYV